MTHIGTLWGSVRQRQTKVILSVAAINGLELLQSEILSMKDKPADFTAKFSYGKIPAFEGTDGFKLIEGAAIARYVSSIGSNVKLLGSNEQENAVVDQWLHFAEHEIGVPSYNVMALVYGLYQPFNPENLEKTHERIVRALVFLESHLATSSSGYVALNTLTLADFVLASVIFVASTVSLGSAERAQYPHIFAHYDKVTGDERVKQFWGNEGWVETRITELTKAPWA